MNQLFLNDLSIEPLAADFNDALQRIHKFINTYKSRPMNIFESRICYDQYLGHIQLAPDLNLQDFCNNPNGRTLGSLLLGLTKHPYISPDTPQENSYLESNFVLQKNGQEVPAYGLAAAFLHESIGISFISDTFWENVSFILTIVNNNGSRINQPVLSVSCPNHFQSRDFIEWRDTHTKIELIASNLSPEKKQIHLRDDHGKDTLHSFAKRLIRSPYVIEVINSLPFNPQNTKFIKDIKANGIIELVLTYTDKGLGLVVRTTGRTLRETRQIASILNDEFSC
jgi:hypothetical protein